MALQAVSLRALWHLSVRRTETSCLCRTRSSWVKCFNPAYTAAILYLTTAGVQLCLYCSFALKECNESILNICRLPRCICSVSCYFLHPLKKHKFHSSGFLAQHFSNIQPQYRKLLSTFCGWGIWPVEIKWGAAGCQWMSLVFLFSFKLAIVVQPVHITCFHYDWFFLTTNTLAAK